MGDLPSGMYCVCGLVNKPDAAIAMLRAQTTRSSLPSGTVDVAGLLFDVVRLKESCQLTVNK